MTTVAGLEGIFLIIPFNCFYLVTEDRAIYHNVINYNSHLLVTVEVWVLESSIFLGRNLSIFQS